MPETGGVYHTLAEPSAIDSTRTLSPSILPGPRTSTTSTEASKPIGRMGRPCTSQPCTRKLADEPATAFDRPLPIATECIPLTGFLELTALDGVPPCLIP